MSTLMSEGRTYEVDELGFLLDGAAWTVDFARAAAPGAGVSGELRDEHWAVIRFIREHFERTGRCPLVYQVCRGTGLSLSEFRLLFPAGWLRGACKLAGLTYREGYVTSWRARPAAAPRRRSSIPQKTYTVDVRGFLVDPGEWDERFAAHRAEELGVREGLSDRHWEILRFLRERHEATGAVPTVYETCEAFGLDLPALERLFPTGYHRGAVKIAGLRVR